MKSFSTTFRAGRLAIFLFLLTPWLMPMVLPSQGAEKRAVLKRYALGFDLDDSQTFNDGSGPRKWTFTTTGAGGAPYGSVDGRYSGELKPMTRNFSTGVNTFKADFIYWDTTSSDWRALSYGNFSIDLPTTDHSGPNGAPDGVPDIFQKELAFQLTATGHVEIRSVPSSGGTMQTTFTRAAGSANGTYELRFGVGSVITALGNFSVLNGIHTVAYEASTRQILFFNSNGGGASTFTNSGPDTLNVSAWTESYNDGVTHSLRSLAFSRSGRAYRGIMEFINGSFQYSYAAYVFAAVSLTDENDTDQDGIPDLTDPFVEPTFVLHPQSQGAYAGSTVTLTARANAYPDVNYQWRKDDVNIPGATGTSLVLANVQSVHEGTYDVKAQNAAGIAFSSPAYLKVCGYSFSPASPVFVAEGGYTSVTVTAPGGCPWSVLNTNHWIALTSGSIGEGDGSFTFYMQPNPHPYTRAGFFTIGPKTYAVTQLGLPAPSSLAGKTLALTMTEADGFPTNRSFNLFFGQTNQYRFMEQTNIETGTYSYSKIDDYNGNLILTNMNASGFLGQLMFVWPDSGYYFVTNESLETQFGQFVLSTTRPDWDGDGSTDLLFQKTNGLLSAWLMRGTNFLGSASLRNGSPAGIGWRVVGQSDFNQDDESDLLFQHDNGKLAVWFMRRTNLIGAVTLRNGVAVASGWQAMGVSDFNNDNQPDICFQHTNGKTSVWYMNGTNYLGGSLLRNGAPASAGWRMAGLNDFDGDGQTDLLWQHTDGRIAIWYMVGSNFVTSVLVRNGVAAGAGWRVAGLADFNQDGLSDLLFQNTTSRKIAVWFMNGNAFVSSVLLRGGSPIAAGWSLVGPK